MPDSQTTTEELSPLQMLYLGHSLRLRQPKWEQQSNNRVLIEAKIDAIPHQVEAAMFAFRNPMSGGVILADEVGLGKTIETGLILSQLWAEGKRSFLIISPKSLRHQWQDELKTLFYLESQIVDTNAYRKIKANKDSEDPFFKSSKIIITNEHFVEKYPEAVRAGKWDFVVIDEAHKLRNVWKNGKNDAKRAKAIRKTIEPYRKLLLTATPIQNNLMELYGLVSFIDPIALGTSESFQRVFKSIPEEAREERLAELKRRMGLFFKRELRQNVSAYIQYTVRNAITITYDPSDEEEELREKFEEYLRSNDSLAIPASASHLLRLVYLKLLASSSFALKNSLLNLYKRLMLQAVLLKNKEAFEKLNSMIREALTLEGNRKAHELETFEKKLYKGVRKKTFEGLLAEFEAGSVIEDLADDDEEIAETYVAESEREASAAQDDETNTASLGKLVDEAGLILSFIKLSRTIAENKKAKALISTLKQQFEKARSQGWPEKAVIFTEFRATQDYVITALEELGLNLERDVVVFNGSSGDAESRKRLVEEFKGAKKVFLTTEAGAEGLNLQCANLIVNYDLPWNPQRIEQRIGRCHRYGQKLDVVVVNFVNEKNVADKRVLELLQEKFNLFKGAFGASDEVLGLIESGMDFEREIMKIYLACRTGEEIRKAFDALLEKNRDLVDSKMREVKENILSAFDEEVQKKLRVLHEKTLNEIDAIQKRVRELILSSLGDVDYSYDGKVLKLAQASSGLSAGIPYTFHKEVAKSGAELLHSSSDCVSRALADIPKSGHVVFQLTGRHNISMLNKFVGAKGDLALYKVRVKGLDEKEHLVPVIRLADGTFMDEEHSEKIISVTSVVTGSSDAAASADVEALVRKRAEPLVQMFSEYHEELYDEEVEKLEGYYEDMQELKRCEIDDVQKEIDALKDERQKLPFKAKKELNSKIQKLKDKQAALEDEISEIRRKSRDDEKAKSKKLQDEGEIREEFELLFAGKFEIA